MRIDKNCTISLSIDPNEVDDLEKFSIAFGNMPVSEEVMIEVELNLKVEGFIEEPVISGPAENWSPGHSEIDVVEICYEGNEVHEVLNESQIEQIGNLAWEKIND